MNNPFVTIDNKISGILSSHLRLVPVSPLYHFVPLALLLIVVVITQSYSITNESMPSGDANRIMPYVEFVDNSSVMIPLWNPYKFAGTPTLADPERFILLSQFISVDDDYLYLKFNLLQIALVFFIGVACYFLAHQFHISRAGSLVAASLLVSSQLIFNLVKSGRVDGLVSALLLLLIYLFYVFYVRDNRKLLLIPISLMMAVDINLHGYYALVTLYPLLFLIGLFVSSGDRLQRFVTTSRDLTVFTIIAVGVGMVYLLPLMDYTVGIYADVDSRSTLAMSQPILGSILNVFVPLYVEHQKGLGFVFGYISLLVFPLLVVYLHARKQTPWRYESLFLVLLLYGLIFNLGRLFPFSVIVDVFSSLPLLGQIRWSNAFWFSVVVSAVIFSGAAVDRLRGLHISQYQAGRIKKGIIFVIVTLFAIDVLSSLTFLWEGRTREDFFILRQLYHSPELLVYVAAIFLIPWLLRRERLRKYILLLMFIVPVLWHRPYLEMHRLYNQSMPEEYLSIYSNDTSYYRVYQDFNYLGSPHLQNLNGFSLYFPPVHREALSVLFGKKVTALRAHWVDNIPALDEWNQYGLNNLNLKYVEVRNRDITPDTLDGWDVVAERKNKSLLKRKNWMSALEVYADWVTLEHDKVLEQLGGVGIDSSVLMVEAPEGIDIPKMERSSGDFRSSVEIGLRTSDEVLFNVSASSSGMLFVPEYYDKYWVAEVNGAAVPVLRANASFRAVPVPPGESRVHMRYEPKSFYYGLYISLLTILSLLLYVFFGNVRRYRADTNLS